MVVSHITGRSGQALLAALRHTSPAHVPGQAEAVKKSPLQPRCCSAAAASSAGDGVRFVCQPVSLDGCSPASASRSSAVPRQSEEEIRDQNCWFSLAAGSVLLAAAVTARSRSRRRLRGMCMGDRSLSSSVGFRLRGTRVTSVLALQATITCSPQTDRRPKAPHRNPRRNRDQQQRQLAPTSKKQGTVAKLGTTARVQNHPLVSAPAPPRSPLVDTNAGHCTALPRQEAVYATGESTTLVDTTKEASSLAVEAPPQVTDTASTNAKSGGSSGSFQQGAKKEGNEAPGTAKTTYFICPTCHATFKTWQKCRTHQIITRHVDTSSWIHVFRQCCVTKRMITDEVVGTSPAASPPSSPSKSSISAASASSEIDAEGTVASAQTANGRPKRPRRKPCRNRYQLLIHVQNHHLVSAPAPPRSPLVDTNAGHCHSSESSRTSIAEVSDREQSSSSSSAPTKKSDAVTAVADVPPVRPPVMQSQQSQTPETHLPVDGAADDGEGSDSDEDDAAEPEAKGSKGKKARGKLPVRNSVCSQMEAVKAVVDHLKQQPNHKCELSRLGTALSPSVRSCIKSVSAKGSYRNFIRKYNDTFREEPGNSGTDYIISLVNRPVPAVQVADSAVDKPGEEEELVDISATVGPRGSYSLSRPLVEQLLKEEIVAISFEGDLRRTGRISLLSAATKTGMVHLFDIQHGSAGGVDCFRSSRLKELLQSTKIMKVMVGSGLASEALYHLHGVTLRHVLDLQVVWDILRPGDATTPDLDEIRKAYGGGMGGSGGRKAGDPPPPPKSMQQGQSQRWNRLTNFMSTDPEKRVRSVWEQRPLTQAVVTQAEAGARGLLNAALEMVASLPAGSEKETRERCEQQLSELRDRPMCGFENLEPGEKAFFTMENGEMLLVDPEEEPSGGNTRSRKKTAKWEKNEFLKILPLRLKETMHKHGSLERLGDVVLDLGRKLCLRYRLPDGNYTEDRVEPTISKDDLQHIFRQLGGFNNQNRAVIPGSLHRVSAIFKTSKQNQYGIMGLTIRLGRHVPGCLDALEDIVGPHEHSSVLFIGLPGTGKTTILREAAAKLSKHRRVVIVDKSNEIAGEGDVPHECVGYSRRIMVNNSPQGARMLEAVENHTPETVVVDEVSSKGQAGASKTIARRGVQLVCTCHGETLRDLMRNDELNTLIGNVQEVTLGTDDRRYRDKKTIQERVNAPVCNVVVEVRSPGCFVIHRNAAHAVDEILAGRRPLVELRETLADGRFTVTRLTA